MEETIRWDIVRMGELASAVDSKSATLSALRVEALESGEMVGRSLELRRAAFAIDWSSQVAIAIRQRRKLLAAAELTLAAQLGVIVALEPPSWRPELQARPQSEIEADLAAALSAGREAKGAQFVLELATAKRDRILMAETPDVGVVAELQRVIDYLAYEIARERLEHNPDWTRAKNAADRIKELLDESWPRDVTRADLLAINAIVAALDPADLDEVLMLLEDAHLYRWLREMDGIAGGSLTEEEEAAVFVALARSASAATLFRLAVAEHGGKFPEIARAVAGTAPPAVAIEFVEICAAHASESEQALAAALGGLARLGPGARIVAYTALVRSGAAAPLTEATRAFLATQTVERDDPLVVEFVEGVVAAITGTARSIWELTGMALFDTHEFREAWAGLGRTLALLGDDPVEFVAVVLDLDTLTRNPALWMGTTVSDLAALGVGRVARLGRLGKAAQAAASWIKKLSSRKLEVGELTIEAGHLAATIDRLHGAADVLDIRHLADQIDRVTDLAATLDRLPGEIPTLEVASAVALIQRIADTAEEVVDEIAAALAA